MFRYFYFCNTKDGIDGNQKQRMYFMFFFCCIFKTFLETDYGRTLSHYGMNNKLIPKQSKKDADILGKTHRVSTRHLLSLVYLTSYGDMILSFSNLISKATNVAS